MEATRVDISRHPASVHRERNRALRRRQLSAGQRTELMLRLRRIDRRAARVREAIESGSAKALAFRNLQLLKQDVAQFQSALAMARLCELRRSATGSPNLIEAISSMIASAAPRGHTPSSRRGDEAKLGRVESCPLCLGDLFLKREEEIEPVSARRNIVNRDREMSKRRFGPPAERR